MDTGVVDEAALIAAVVPLAVAQGWTVVVAGGITWFQSSGSIGESRIVGGLSPTGTRKLAGFVAADLDQNAIVNATVKGYVNDDSANTTGLAAKAIAQTTAARWLIRDNATTFTYVATVSRDAITVLVKYTSTALIAEGFIYIGPPEPTAGRGLQQQTYARVASINASVPAITVVTLDRNINAGLKDSYLGDPYVAAPLFQSISGPGMPVSDFGLVQRIPILAGSLTTFGGATRFNIDTTAAGKLTGTPGGTNARYRAGRGVGDLVRLYAQPNIVAVGSGATGVYTQGVGQGTNLASWDAYGGQGTNIDVVFTNADIGKQSSNHPAQEVNRFVNYKLYAVVVTNATTMIPQTDNNGKKNVGALRNVLEGSYSTGQIGNFAIIRVDARLSQRYRVLGLFTPAAGVRSIDVAGGGLYRAVAVGPGW